jgi:glutamate N-acetyltransferase/amino-acid N-acetyltransferase
MTGKTAFIPGGTITSPHGFLAGAVCAGIKESAGKRLDLTVLCSEQSCNAAAVFTGNKVKAAPVVLSQQRLRGGRARAVVANSGCANACMGTEGLADAEAVAEAVARQVGALPEEVLVASTGVIGRRLPVDRIKAGIGRIELSAQGGHDFARAIMTTDTVPKEVAVLAGDFSIGGVAKGSGMIHPDMATLLVFIATDSGVELDLLRVALQKAVDTSFNMVSVDGDTSTNDMALLLANGKAGGAMITVGSPQAQVFQEALDTVCIYLAKEIARDGEGATRLIEVVVKGAASETEARQAARTIVGSPLVKTAVHGCDPNWGRVMMALGRSRVEMGEGKTGVSIGGIRVVENGRPADYSESEVARALGEKEVVIEVDLNMGNGSATAWGCDLSEEYVKINAEYTT